MKRIGIADTTFARSDMARAAISAIKKEASVEIVRYTRSRHQGPACSRKEALWKRGMRHSHGSRHARSRQPRTRCALTKLPWADHSPAHDNKHIIEVFVHEDEAPDRAHALGWLAEKRAGLNMH